MSNHSTVHNSQPMLAQTATSLDCCQHPLLNLSPRLHLPAMFAPDGAQQFCCRELQDALHHLAPSSGCCPAVPLQAATSSRWHGRLCSPAPPNRLDGVPALLILQHLPQQLDARLQPRPGSSQGFLARRQRRRSSLLPPLLHRRLDLLVPLPAANARPKVWCVQAAMVRGTRAGLAGAGKWNTTLQRGSPPRPGALKLTAPPLPSPCTSAARAGRPRATFLHAAAGAAARAGVQLCTSRARGCTKQRMPPCGLMPKACMLPCHPLGRRA